MGEEAPPGRSRRFIALTQLLWVAGIAVTGLLALAPADLDAAAARLLYLHLLAVALVVLALRLRLGESREWRRARDDLDQHQDPDPGGGGAAPPTTHSRASTQVVVALGAYYALWNLGANTLGQFKPFLWVGVLGGDARGASLLILGVLPLGVVGGLVFAHVVDSTSRRVWVTTAMLVA